MRIKAKHYLKLRLFNLNMSILLKYKSIHMHLRSLLIAFYYNVIV